MTENKHIQVQQEGRVLRVTLNRPEKRNALDLHFCRELVTTFDAADTDRSIGAILLDASGPVFCAGMDLRETAAVDQVQLAGIHDRLFTTIHRIKTPMIAAVHGAALAGGAGLVANCQIVFARPETRFALTEIRIGLWPVLIFRALEHAIGERRAVELSLTGREFRASDAFDWGLVTEITDDPLARALETAKMIAAFSPIAVGTGLEYVHQIRGRDWDHAGRVGREMRNRLLANPDFREGTQAFLEKRQPSWPSLEE